jgi:hypothetical protein
MEKNGKNTCCHQVSALLSLVPARRFSTKQAIGWRSPYAQNPASAGFLFGNHRAEAAIEE